MIERMILHDIVISILKATNLPHQRLTDVLDVACVGKNSQSSLCDQYYWINWKIISLEWNYSFLDIVSKLKCKSIVEYGIRCFL